MQVGKRGESLSPLQALALLNNSLVLAMSRYMAERLEAGWDDVHNFTFGHMGDGNLHLVISVGEGGRETRARVEACVYEPLESIAGSVSAEHGVGLEKKPYLGISRSETEIALMRTIKKALDPKGILNPGKIFDAEAAV
jgi:FAD/FMN-containing dehydrogenase